MAYLKFLGLRCPTCDGSLLPSCSRQRNGRRERGLAHWSRSLHRRARPLSGGDGYRIESPRQLVGLAALDRGGRRGVKGYPEAHSLRCRRTSEKREKRAGGCLSQRFIVEIREGWGRSRSLPVGPCEVAVCRGNVVQADPQFIEECKICSARGRSWGGRHRDRRVVRTGTGTNAKVEGRVHRLSWRHRGGGDCEVQLAARGRTIILPTGTGAVDGALDVEGACVEAAAHPHIVCPRSKSHRRTEA